MSSQPEQCPHPDGEPTPHPSETAQPAVTRVVSSPDPLGTWVGFAAVRVDRVVEKMDQAYRDLKLAATNADAADRRLAGAAAEGIGDQPHIPLPSHLAEAHRTALETYGRLAEALAGSIHQVSMARVETLAAMEVPV